jgi:hypothetical protein
MATLGELVVQFPIIKPYVPYPSYNHHLTMVGVIPQIAGWDHVFTNDEIWLAFATGQNPTGALPAKNVVTTGTVTTGEGFLINDTSKSWTTNEHVGRAWYGRNTANELVARHIISNTATQLTFDTENGSLGAGLGILPLLAGKTYEIQSNLLFFRQLAAWNTLPKALYLPHNKYTLFAMVYNQSSLPKVAGQYLDIDAYLSSRPGIHNENSPIVIARTQNQVASTNTVTVQGVKGQTIRVYNIKQVNETALEALTPPESDGAFAIDGIAYVRKKLVSFNTNPLASNVITADNGQITITYTNDTATYGADGKYVVSAQGEGFGESFGTAFFSSNSANADCRQIKTYWTATTTTSSDGAVTKRQNGVVCRFYTIQCKQVNIGTGAETIPDQSAFYYNNNNDGDGNNKSISLGVWFPVGQRTTILIADNAGSPINGYISAYFTYHSQNVDVPGLTGTVLTPFLDSTDAITRGSNPLLAKETETWWSTGWGVGDTVYVNNDPNDNTKAPYGTFYGLNSAITINTSGVITARVY